MPQGDIKLKDRQRNVQRERDLLDAALKQQAAGTYVDPTFAAKDFLRKPTVGQRVTDTETNDLAALDAQQAASRDQRSTLEGTAKSLLLPAAFVGGPVGMAAGGLMALDGITSAFGEGGTTGQKALAAGGAALSALPIMKALKGAKTLGPDQYRQIWQGPLRKPKEPTEDWEALSSLRREPGPQAAAPVSKMRNTEDEVLEGVTPAPLSFMDRTHTANKARWKQEESLRGLDEATGGASMDEVDDLIGSMKPTPMGRTPTAMDDFPTSAGIARKAKAPGRADAAVKADVETFRKAQDHGVGGFSRLPSLSASELTRISKNIERVTGKR